MRSQHIIIATILTGLIAGMFYLAKTAYDQQQANRDFWSIYFADPVGQNNAFVIDNATKDDATFHYEIMTESKTREENDITVKKDERKLIKIPTLNNVPVMIKVTNNTEEKTIEKK